jgi:hypothetical protein
MCVGIIIKYENMSYKTAVHHAHLILSLTAKATKYVRDLFDPPDVSYYITMFINNACIHKFKQFINNQINLYIYMIVHIHNVLERSGFNPH